MLNAFIQHVAILRVVAPFSLLGPKTLELYCFQNEN
jgi:hypothetical protein